ncbi:MAG: hypothetical protein ACE5QF_01245 [Thermoplasmata archaeon]
MRRDIQNTGLFAILALPHIQSVVHQCCPYGPKPDFACSTRPVAKKRRLSVYNVAISDYFHAPEVNDIDMSMY